MLIDKYLYMNTKFISLHQNWRRTTANCQKLCSLIYRSQHSFLNLFQHGLQVESRHEMCVKEVVVGFVEIIKCLIAVYHIYLVNNYLVSKDSSST